MYLGAEGTTYIHIYCRISSLETQCTHQTGGEFCDVYPPVIYMRYWTTFTCKSLQEGAHFNTNRTYMGTHQTVRVMLWVHQ